MYSHRARVPFLAVDASPDVLGVEADRRRRQPLHVVCVERARADAGGAVLGLVARALGRGASRMAADDRARVRRDAAEGLDEGDLDRDALGDGVAVGAGLALDPALSTWVPAGSSVSVCE